MENTVAAENSILLHPQEQAAKIRMEKERTKWVSVCVCVLIPISVMVQKTVIYRRLHRASGCTAAVDPFNVLVTLEINCYCNIFCT